MYSSRQASLIFAAMDLAERSGVQTRWAYSAISGCCQPKFSTVPTPAWTAPSLIIIYKSPVRPIRRVS